MTRCEENKMVINEITKRTNQNPILDQIMEFVDQQRVYQEKELAWIITKYDFIVGSIECKNKLMEILPDEANIVYSPYVEDPTKIYAVKKFDIKDLIKYEDGLNFGDQDTMMPAT